MAKTEPAKRNLTFENFDDVMADVNSLIASGYVSHGNWNLAQSCGHLAEWVRFPVDGFPKPPLPLRMIFWVMKKTVGPGMKRKILAEGFKGGVPTAPDTVPAADAQTDQEAAQHFQSTFERVISHKGLLHPSPLFGPMDMEMLVKVTLLHAEHHLGYLEPKA